MTCCSSHSWSERQRESGVVERSCAGMTFLFGGMAHRTARGRSPWQLPVSQSVSQ
jgi:hypothetical protein